MAGTRNPDQGAFRQRNPHRLTLAAVDRAVAEAATLHAGNRRSSLAVRACHVAVDEGGDHQVTAGDGRHLSPGLLDHSDEFVADGPDGVGALAPVVPQVGPADAGQHDPDDGVGRLTDHRVWPLADLDVPRSTENGGSHSYLASRAMSERFWSRDTDRSHAHQTISAFGEGEHVDRGY
jgi:hypothetical protein